MNDILNNIYDGVILVLLFGVTIFAHELGHFLLALRCGMVVDAFSIGFGPAIWKKKIRATTYKIGCIPFGGYVALPQLDPAAMSAIQGSPSSADNPEKTDNQAGRAENEKHNKENRTLPHVAAWKKILVSLSGVAGNFMFAVLLAWIIYLVPDAATPDEKGAIVGDVATNSAAFLLGLRPGDEIVAVNDERVNTWYEYSVLCLLGAGESNRIDLTIKSDGSLKKINVPTSETDMGIQAVEGIDKAMPCLISDVMPGGGAEAAGIEPNDIVKEFDGVSIVGAQHFIRLVDSRAGKAAPVVVERNGKLIKLTVTPRFDPERGRALIGVVLGSFDAAVMPWMQHKEPMRQIAGDAMGIVRFLKALITPRESKHARQGVGGPVMIIATLWISIQTSILNAVGFLRFLNVNLAVLNLLPIPVLDGGHILFGAWEAVTRRKANPRFVNFVVNVFATLLIGLLVLLTFRDFFRLSKFWHIFHEESGEPAAGITNNVSEQHGE